MLGAWHIPINEANQSHTNTHPPDRQMLWYSFMLWLDITQFLMFSLLARAFFLRIFFCRCVSRKIIHLYLRLTNYNGHKENSRYMTFTPIKEDSVNALLICGLQEEKRCNFRFIDLWTFWMGQQLFSCSAINRCDHWNGFIVLSYFFHYLFTVSSITELSTSDICW